MKEQLKKGDKVRLHTGKNTRSPINDSVVYEITVAPNDKFDFFTIRDYYRGGNIYNVNGKRLSKIEL